MSDANGANTNYLVVLVTLWLVLGHGMEGTEKNTKKREGKGGAALCDSPSPRW